MHQFAIHLQVSSTVPPVLSVPGKKTYSKLLNKGHATIRMALKDPQISCDLDILEWWEGTVKMSDLHQIFHIAWLFLKGNKQY